MASLETLPRDVLALVLSRLVSERDASAVDCVCRTLLAANGDGAWKGFAVRGLLLREEHAVGHSSWRALIQTVVVPVVRLLRKVARPRTGRDGTQAAWSAEEAEAAHARNGLLPLEAAVGFGAMSHFGLTAMGQQGASTQSRVFFDRSRNTDDFVFMGSPDMRSGGEMVQYLQVRGSVACCPAPPDTGIEVEERVPQQHFAAGAVCMFFAQEGKCCDEWVRDSLGRVVEPLCYVPPFAWPSFSAFLQTVLYSLCDDKTGMPLHPPPDWSGQ